MITLAELPVTQRDALHACVASGELRRSHAGYIDLDKRFYTRRALFALERAELVENIPGTSNFRPTAAGIAVNGEDHARAIHAADNGN